MTTTRQGWLTTRLDTALFIFAGISVAWLAYLVLREGIRPGWPSLLIVLFWALVAYLALPRLHRILTRIYLPGYFIGRARTSDGLLGDPINLALLGSEEQVHEAMARAGWTRADDLSFPTGMRIVTSTLGRRSYAEAPVSPLHLFGRQQDFAYQQEVEGSPSKRHHVRFWRCPPQWLLPGGFRVDWLAAGTFDRSVGLSLFTLQVTHKIDPDTDVERDHIVTTMSTASPEVEVRILENFATGYHSRNGGGDLIETDGDLPVVDVTAVVAPIGVTPRVSGKTQGRPFQTIFGASVAVLLGMFYVALASLLLATLTAGGALGPDPDEEVVSAILLLGVVAIAGAVNLALGLGTLAGRNWARILLSLFSVATITTAYLANARGSEVIGLSTNLVPVSISVLVLLALSSQSAREYATRGRRNVSQS